MASPVSLYHDTAATATSTEKPMLRRRRGPRCQLCKRQHQKVSQLDYQHTNRPTRSTYLIPITQCRFTHDREVCDRCLNLGYECRLMTRTERRPTPPVRAPRAKRGSNIFKCDACRQHHQKCEPEDRVWPARCTRCIKQKQQCTPPRDALGRNIPYIRGGEGIGGGGCDGGDGGHDVGQGVVRANHNSGSLEPWPGRPVPPADHAPPPPPAAYESEVSGASSEETPASGFGLLLPAREEGAGGPPPRTRTGTADMGTNDTGETIRRMEDEFHDVLRQLEKRHARELDAQRGRYEEELGVQRDRYEQRLDDLIRIMRNMGRQH
ncbi:hypothetical protein SLS62_004784 [Diatrype stigma]|uniref:Zn(2)-C6 fungal-type domain-containing protein n=1 Tax=Diatrype stigma TaxID=117547 RepID=A0AAN9UW17_9PEZI